MGYENDERQKSVEKRKLLDRFCLREKYKWCRFGSNELSSESELSKCTLSFTANKRLAQCKNAPEMLLR